jgi:hypothetical protein
MCYCCHSTVTSLYLMGGKYYCHMCYFDIWHTRSLGVWEH